MRPSRIAATVSAALLLAAAVSACGGGGSSSNGVASKSADGIVNAARTAIQGVGSVHVSGAITSGGTHVTLNLDLVNGKGGRGSMSENGLSFKLIDIGDSVYINGSDSFWRNFGGSAAVQLFHGRWLKAPATGGLRSIANLTNVHSLFAGLTAHGNLSKGPTATVNGQQAITVKDTSKGGTLYVATTGKPYPLRISKSGSGDGKVDFSKFNEPVSLTPPANPVDISKLKN